MDDHELLTRLKTDPEEGMRILIQRYSGLLWTIARSKLHPNYFDAADVEDCVSEVLSRFYLDLDCFDRSKSSIRTYLSLMVRRKCIDLLRRANRAGIPVSIEDDEVLQIPSQGDSPEQMSVKKDEGRRALSLIEGMGEPDRTILLGKYYFGYPTKALASRLGMRPGTLDTRAFRLLKKLKKQMEGEEP